jgi:hypothetical protein
VSAVAVQTIALTEELLDAVADIAGGSVVEDPETEAVAAAVAVALPSDEAEFAAPPSAES